ncbi:uncharacterized protein TA11530 [Theileria annulata]|uniref:Uncharacterized protein n=1 Tax=Theileria annulata TaxID=5874 RepID=Q4UDJ3_THEAN|nr:uncharacterized protein TA11530 [Theileria annulata]CAI74846.1 hypothetical protein TA11530 [Theileria annulata]|eukprot:XP_952578.1 hypothetical protein TA11530 [Theileria annulata]
MFRDELNEEEPDFSGGPSSPSLTPLENTLCDKSKVSTIVSNITLNFSRRVPSKIKPVLESSIEENADKISVSDMLDLVISLRKCNSLSNKLFQVILERIDEDIKKVDGSNNEYNNFLLKICLELVEHSFESLKAIKTHDENSCKVENINNCEDFKPNQLTNNIFKFVCDNMGILKIDDLFRLVPIFFSIQTDKGPQFISLKAEYLYNLTKLILDYELSGGYSERPDTKNTLGANSLYRCNILVKINSSSNNLISLSDQNKPFILDKEKNMTKLKEYVQSYIYPTISENITKFTSQNIVELAEIIRRLGEPYPASLIDRICTVYVKHISQYSIDNMMKLVEELNLMGIKNELVLLNTIINLPRKATTLDSFERVIKLLEVFKTHESEYLDILVSQQIYQIYHKINKKYLEVSYA